MGKGRISKIVGKIDKKITINGFEDEIHEVVAALKYNNELRNKRKLKYIPKTLVKNHIFTFISIKLFILVVV